MIIWLAGWPHNGSTLCRQIIKDCLDITSVSKYNEPGLEQFFPGAQDFLKDWDGDHLRKLQYYRETPETYIVKTHEQPIDNAQAIFVVRDGRDAVSALSHFWRIPIKDAIVGQGCLFGSWSGYYWGWNPKVRPNTLLVKFEDMVTRPTDVAVMIGEFLGIEKKHNYVDHFEQDKKKYPQLFHDSSDVWQKRMSESDLDLFWKCHRSVMEEAQYG